MNNKVIVSVKTVRDLAEMLKQYQNEKLEVVVIYQRR